jgi:hypothetical protein
MDELKIVKEGAFLHDGTVLRGVRIVLRQTRAGSGDFEDPPGIREDLDTPTFCVWLRARLTSIPTPMTSRASIR